MGAGVRTEPFPRDASNAAVLVILQRQFLQVTPTMRPSQDSCRLCVKRRQRVSSGLSNLRLSILGVDLQRDNRRSRTIAG